MVSRSIALYASRSGSAPQPTIRHAPTSATPARSIASPGHFTDREGKIACREDSSRRELSRGVVVLRHEPRHDRSRECEHHHERGGNHTDRDRRAPPIRKRAGAQFEAIAGSGSGSGALYSPVLRLRVSDTPSQNTRNATVAQPARKRKAAL